MFSLYIFIFTFIDSIMKTYEQFWEELKPAYPLTKWEIKLPIATSLETYNDIHIPEVVKELDVVMQKVFQKETQARELAELEYGKQFTDLYEWKYTGIVRFDCMIDATNTLKIVEVNTKRPDGLLMHDMTYSVLSGKTNTSHLDLFLRFFNKDEYIFILYEKWGFEDLHFLEYEKLKESGYTVWIWWFDDIDFHDGQAFWQTNKIDVIRLSISHGRLDTKECDLLKSAHVRFVNTFDLAWFGDKSLLTGIDHPMLMETFILNATNQDKVMHHKDTYVIKPTNRDEWTGVYIWIDMSQKERKELIEKNLYNSYLAQEYITISTKKTSMYQDGGIIEDNFYYDFCPHLFYKDGVLIGVGHILVRYSKSKIVNVLRWWGIGYYQQEK